MYQDLAILYKITYSQRDLAVGFRKRDNWGGRHILYVVMHAEHAFYLIQSALGVA